MNNPEKVNPETRDRVLQVIKELGYKPNAIARGLASRKTTTVGVVMADVSRASVSQLLGGIIDTAKKYEYAVKLFSILENDDIKETIASVVAEQVDGILFLNDELDAEQSEIVLNSFKEAQIPVVLCNVLYQDDVPTVSIDYEESTYKVTKNLIEKGRKNIYLLSTFRKYTIDKHKEIGYIRAMEEAGREPNIFRTSGLVDFNSEHFKEYFKDHEIDGAISVRDSIAISFMNYAIEHGLRVPEDVSVIGLQNTKYAILSRPKLTCVHTPIFDIGAESMKLLTKYMKQEEVEKSRIILPFTIIERGSN
jgi:LacI family transcriptional regulator